MKIHFVQVFFFMNGSYFSIIIWSFSKVMEILVKNVMKTVDVNKIFLAIFESYYDLYMYHFLWL